MREKEGWKKRKIKCVSNAQISILQKISRIFLLFIIYTIYGCALFHSTHSSNVTPLPPKISNAL
jgi:hypothetical protein